MHAGLTLRGASQHTLQGASQMIVRFQGAIACTCFRCCPLPTATLTFRMSMARRGAVLGCVCAAAVIGAVRSAVRPWGLELASTAAPVGGLLRLWTAVVTGVRGLCVCACAATCAGAMAEGAGSGQCMATPPRLHASNVVATR